MKLQVEEYNGTSWTEVNDLNTGRYGVAYSWNSNSCFSFWVENLQINMQNRSNMMEQIGLKVEI